MHAGRIGPASRHAVKCIQWMHAGLFLLLCQVVSGVDYPSTGTSHNPIIQYRINEDWYLSSINNYATKNGVDEFAIAYVDLTLGRKIDSHWSVDAGYRHAWIDLAGDTRQERRPLVNLRRKDRAGGWFVLNRSRLEWRDFEDAFLEDRFRFRHQLLGVSPWSIPGTRIRWYAEEEFFYEFNDAGFNMNWLATGFRYRWSDSLTLKLGYRWQTQKIADNCN